MLLTAVLLSAALAAEEMVVSPAPAVPRVNNNTESSAYGASEVQTHLRVDVKDDTSAVRFIRDNNAPFVVTKAFPLKHADAYEIRGYIVAAISGKQFSSSPVTVDAIKFYDGSMREVEPVPLKLEAHALQPAGAFRLLAVFGPVVEIAHHAVLRQVRHGGGRGGACGKQGQQEAEKPGP